MEPHATEDRLTQIESRLSRIEAHLHLSASSPQKPSHEPPPQTSKTSFESSETPPPTSWVDIPEPSLQSWPEAEPGNWLGIIAVICFVLAAGFIIKLSIEAGWLTPARQVGLAALLGFSLIGAGLSLLKSDRAYASLLPGAGIIILYLTTFAAHRYYDLISFEAGIALTVAVSSACIFLYTQIKHDVYAITAAVGAYLAPAVLGIHSDTFFSLYYFMLCSVAFTTISLWLESRILTVISSYLALFMSALVALNIQPNQFLAVMLALQFFIFSVGSYLYTIYNQEPLRKEESWSFLPVLLLFYGVEYHLMNQLYPGLAPWISLGFAAVLIGLYLSARKYVPNGLGSQSLILSFATVVCFHSIYLELLPDAFRPWLFVFIMIGFVFLPANLLSDKEESVFFIPSFAFLAILFIEYISMLLHLLNSADSLWLIVSFAAVVSLWVAIAFADKRGIKRPSYDHAFLGAAHILAVLALYRLTTGVSSLAVSASWLFYAVAVLAFSYVREDEAMAKSALFVLTFAAGKALLYDAAAAPTVVRIFCLLLTGVVLYGCGIFVRQIDSWQDPQEKIKPSHPRNELE